MLNKLEVDTFEPTMFEYPVGYFDIQYQFAKRVVELGVSPNLPSAIVSHTAICRRLFGKKGDIPHNWQEISVSPLTIWQFYSADPSHQFKTKIDDGCHQGGFMLKPLPKQDLIFDIATGLQKIELHFDNHRGEGRSEYSRQFIPKMLEDMTILINNVSTRMKSDPNFHPETVTLGSWMNNFPGIRAVLPPEFVASGEYLRPPSLSLKGDSLWGQFLKNDGGVNQERYELFSSRLPQCQNLDDLVDAIPVPVVLFKSPLNDFFRFYQVENSVK